MRSASSLLSLACVAASCAAAAGRGALSAPASAERHHEMGAPNKLLRCAGGCERGRAHTSKRTATACTGGRCPPGLGNISST